VGYQRDSNGQPFDGNHKYQIRFEADALPPVGAFWSITAYNASKFLIDNPIDRYVINSPMLPSLKKDASGGFTLYLEHESPGRDLESKLAAGVEGCFQLGVPDLPAWPGDPRWELAGAAGGLRRRSFCSLKPCFLRASQKKRNE